MNSYEFKYKIGLLSKLRNVCIYGFTSVGSHKVKNDRIMHIHIL